MRLSFVTIPILLAFLCLALTDSAAVSKLGKEDVVDEYLTGFVLFRQVGTDNEIEFLVQKKTWEDGNDEWGPVLGPVEETDDSIFDAAVRIIFEQTGLTPEDYEPQGLRQMSQYVNGDKVTEVNLWPAKLHWPDVPIIPTSEVDHKWSNMTAMKQLLNERWSAEFSLIHDSLIL